MADYLEAYAARFELPVRSGVTVDALSRDGDRYVVAAGDRSFEADNVVVASGAYHSPRIPAFANELDPSIVRLHSSEYRNPAQLTDGRVLVVGAGNSGAEIAFDVSRTSPDLALGAGHGPSPCSDWHPARPAPDSAILVLRVARTDRADADRQEGSAEAPGWGCAARTGAAEGTRGRRSRAGTEDDRGSGGAARA